jgi:hypothetical protein
MRKSTVYSRLSLILSIIWLGCVPILFGMLGGGVIPWPVSAAFVVLIVLTVVLIALMLMWPAKPDKDFGGEPAEGQRTNRKIATVRDRRRKGGHLDD